MCGARTACQFRGVASTTAPGWPDDAYRNALLKNDLSPTGPVPVGNRFGNYNDRPSAPPIASAATGGGSDRRQACTWLRVVHKPCFRRHRAGGECRSIAPKFPWASQMSSRVPAGAQPSSKRTNTLNISFTMLRSLGKTAEKAADAPSDGLSTPSASCFSWSRSFTACPLIPMQSHSTANGPTA